MSENISVRPDFLQKVIGLTEAVKGIMDKRASAEKAIRAKATEAVTQLAKKGYVEADQTNAMVEGFVTEPNRALEALTKMAEQVTHINEVASVGAAAEKEASSSDGSTIKDSDRIWNEGFGLQQ